MPFGLFEMLLKAHSEVPGSSGFRYLGQGLSQLFFGAIQISQFIDVKLSQ